MRITKKSEYAIRALTRIAIDQEKGTLVTLIKDISASENIPRKYLERILLDLNNAGLLTSKRGVGGGYALSKSPREINLEEIVSIVDGQIAPLDCIGDEDFSRCPTEQQCGLYRVMLEVKDAVSKVLGNISLKDLATASMELIERNQNVPSYVI